MRKSLVHKPRRRKTGGVPNGTSGVLIDAPDQPVAQPSAEFIERDQRHALVCERAYYLAEQRAFAPGHEVDDWLAAERELERAWATGSGEGPTLCGD